MKKPIMRPLLACTVILLLSVFSATPLSAQSALTSVEVILVKAGNDGEGIDSGLRPYASTLQRLFRFKSYQQHGRKSLRFSVPGEDSVDLPGGQTLSLKAMEPAGRGIKADLQWQRGGKRLLHTRINLQRGSPAVLGGPRSKDGTWLLILILR